MIEEGAQKKGDQVADQIGDGKGEDADRLVEMFEERAICHVPRVERKLMILGM